SGARSVRNSSTGSTTSSCSTLSPRKTSRRSCVSWWAGSTSSSPTRASGWSLPTWPSISSCERDSTPRMEPGSCAGRSRSTSRTPWPRPSCAGSSQKAHGSKWTPTGRTFSSGRSRSRKLRWRWPNTRQRRTDRQSLKYVRGGICLSIFFALVLLSTRAALSQTPPETPARPIIIRDIAVQGNRRVQEAVILGRVTAKVGTPFVPTRLAEDIRNIFALGFFDDVQLKVEDFEGGVKLVFVVSERPFVRDVIFAGN